MRGPVAGSTAANCVSVAASGNAFVTTFVTAFGATASVPARASASFLFATASAAMLATATAVAAVTATATATAVTAGAATRDFSKQ